MSTQRAGSEARNLIFIAKPGTASNPNTACGSTYLTTYGCPSTLAIPGGYNEVEADGNPAFETGFGTTLTGLTAGQTYELDFYQAASQQTTFTGDTTEQWIVRLRQRISPVRWQRRRCLHYGTSTLHVFEPGCERKCRGNTTHEHAVRRPDGLELRLCPADSGRSDPGSQFPGVGRQRQHHQSSADRVPDRGRFAIGSHDARASDVVPLRFGSCGSCGQAASTRKTGVR